MSLLLGEVSLPKWVFRGKKMACNKLGLALDLNSLGAVWAIRSRYVVAKYIIVLSYYVGVI